LEYQPDLIEKRKKVIEFFSISIGIVILLDFLVTAALAAESSASIYSVTEPHGRTEPVVSLKRGADETVFALHTTRSVLHFLLAASLVGLMASIYGISWVSTLLTVFIGALLINGLELIVTTMVSRRPYGWLANLQGVSRTALILTAPLISFRIPAKVDDLAEEPGQTPVTAEELQTWAAAANETGGLEPEERRMIQSIFEFGEILCREVMVPRVDVRTLDVHANVPEAIEAFTRTGHSRIPVFEDDLDNIVGILYAKDLLQYTNDQEQDKPIAEFLRPAFFVPEMKKVDELLREMQARGVHIAMVVDEYGGLAGLVTLEDILEEIIGEIRDEYDPAEEQPYQQMDEDTYLVQGWMSVVAFNAVFNTDLSQNQAETIGGVFISMLGKIPVGGEAIELEGWQVKIEQVIGRRIRKVYLHRIPEEINPEAS
jgi:CBS domain containing-hemolysin-like protein